MGSNTRQEIETQLKHRILLIDGGMGTMIQGHKLEEADYRGERFANWHCDLKGNNDLLVLTQPDLIKAIHCEYLQAGADILETNTFNATTIAMADYDMESLSEEINYQAARLAVQRLMNGQQRIHKSLVMLPVYLVLLIVLALFLQMLMTQVTVM